MRLRIFFGFAALAAAALSIGDVEAFGRRCRGRRGGGGCGGNDAAPVLYQGGCDGCSTGFGTGPPGWAQIGNQAYFRDPATGALYLPSASAMPGLFSQPAGGASAAIAADRQRRANALFIFDPAIGALRQVGWVGADGTLHRLYESGESPPK